MTLRTTGRSLALVGVAGLLGAGASVLAPPETLHAQTALTTPGLRDSALSPTEAAARAQVQDRLKEDLTAVGTFRPAYSFWQHIFTIPDGRIVFGSAEDGRLLATFPARGDWARQAEWEEPALASVLEGRRLPSRLSDRRDEVERLLADQTGPVVHNATRGLFLLPNAGRYGSFLAQWAEIYERFGVPAEIGLAQAVVESGLNGRVRSNARALGFCQWLPRNWNQLKRLTPHVIEGYNQTTQAGYCAAYLTILAAMYGSFIPALSEHHAGGVNVGRTVINGARLGGDGAREQYLLGSQFARDLRQISIRRYRQLFRTYGPRSFLYAEMVFGNTLNVRRMMREIEQETIYAMRAPRNMSLRDIARTTGLSTDEVKRFNPALVRQVPRRATLYLPTYVEAFGPNVSYWHRQAPEAYAEALRDFLELDATVEEWHQPGFADVLRSFRSRFEATESEEGMIMATTLSFVIGDLTTSRRADILREFRTSRRIQSLFEQGRRELASGH